MKGNAAAPGDPSTSMPAGERLRGVRLPAFAFPAGLAAARRRRRSIEQMRRWIGSVDQPLLQLAILERNGELLVRLEDVLADSSGQRHFDFDEVSDLPEVT